jgi:hypothetical protein
MNIFDLRENVINDDQQYVESFFSIQDERIRNFVIQKGFNGLFVAKANTATAASCLKHGGGCLGIG